jgi:predicted Zn-dependent protease
MIKHLLNLGEKSSFTTTEIYRDKTAQEECHRINGLLSVHSSNSDTYSTRCFKETGAPQGFIISDPTLATAKRAFANIAAAGFPSKSRNVAHLLPSAVKKTNLQIYDPGIERWPEGQFQQLSGKIDDYLSLFKGLALKDIKFQKVLKKVYITNSKGLTAKYKRTYFNLSLTILYGQNMVEVNERKPFFQQLDPQRLIARGASLLDSLADPVQAPLDTEYIVLAPEASVSILKEFSNRLKYTSRQKNPRLHFAKELSIVDNKSEPGLSGSVPFDDEGIQTDAHCIIDKGMFRTPISDLASSARNRHWSSGNGFRSPQSPFPQVKFSNLFIKPGTFELPTLLRGAHKGIFISLVKLRQLDGDGVVFSAYGFPFSNGEILRHQPVHLLVKTSFQSYFLNILKVSKEIKYFHRQFNIGSPSLLLKGGFNRQQIFVIGG